MPDSSNYINDATNALLTGSVLEYASWCRPCGISGCACIGDENG